MVKSGMLNPPFKFFFLSLQRSTEVREAAELFDAGMNATRLETETGFAPKMSLS